MQKPTKIEEVKTELHCSQERKLDLVNLIAECTVVENELRDYINECMDNDLIVDRKMLIEKYNELKKSDPYYQKIEERKKTVDNCMMNVIGSLMFKYEKVGNTRFEHVSFKRQVTITNTDEKYSCISTNIDTPNRVFVTGIGDITVRKKLGLQSFAIQKIIIQRNDFLKIYYYA